MMALILVPNTMAGKKDPAQLTRVKGAPCFLNAIPVGCPLSKAEFVLRWWTMPEAYYRPQLNDLALIRGDKDFYWNLNGNYKGTKPIDMSFRKENSDKDWFVGYTNVKGESADCRLIYEVDRDNNIVAANIILGEARYCDSEDAYWSPMRWAEEVYANGEPCTKWDKSKKGWYIHEMNYDGYIMIPQVYMYPCGKYFYFPFIKIVANKDLIDLVEDYPQPEKKRMSKEEIQLIRERNFHVLHKAFPDLFKY